MMEREDFERAITGLLEIQNQDKYKEEDFQKWFEENQIAFTAYGYKRVIPQPELIDKDGKQYFPDFIVQRHDETWEIFEIKRPDTQILKNKSRRAEFYSSLREYVSQCHDYIEYFDDSINRQYVADTLGINIPKSIKAILVAGINNGFDRVKAQQILYREGAKIELQTYDDIRIRLELYRSELYAKYENLTGLSCHIVLKPIRLEERVNILLDIGKQEDSNRLSLFIDKKDNLIFRIYDDSGIMYTNSIKVDKHGFNYNSWSYITFEIGIGIDYSIMILEINGKYFKDIKLDTLDINYLDILGENNEYFYYTIGSDFKCKAATHMHTNNFMVLNRTLSFEEKYIYRHNYSVEVDNADNTTQYLIKEGQNIQSVTLKSYLSNID